MKGDFRVRPFSDALTAAVQGGVAIIAQLSAQRQAKEMARLKQKVTSEEAAARWLHARKKRHD